MSLPARISHYPRRDGKLPEGAKWVGRPSVFGNPWKPEEFGEVSESTRAIVVACYSDWLAGNSSEDDAKRVQILARLPELRTATALACACPLDQPCHADVLIDLLTADQLEGK